MTLRAKVLYKIFFHLRPNRYMALFYKINLELVGSPSNCDNREGSLKKADSVLRLAWWSLTWLLIRSWFINMEHKRAAFSFVKRSKVGFMLSNLPVPTASGVSTLQSPPSLLVSRCP